MSVRVSKVLLTNLVMTFLIGGSFAPAASKLSSTFTFSGWMARMPFFILPLYIGPSILLFRRLTPWYVQGPVVGAILTVPLVFWTLLPNCPWWKPLVYLVLGAVQGLVLDWIARETPTGATEAHA